MDCTLLRGRPDQFQCMGPSKSVIASACCAKRANRGVLPDPVPDWPCAATTRTSFARIGALLLRTDTTRWRLTPVTWKLLHVLAANAPAQGAGMLELKSVNKIFRTDIVET